MHVHVAVLPTLALVQLGFAAQLNLNARTVEKVTKVDLALLLMQFYR